MAATRTSQKTLIFVTAVPEAKAVEIDVIQTFVVEL